MFNQAIDTNVTATETICLAALITHKQADDDVASAAELCENEAMTTMPPFSRPMGPITRRHRGTAMFLTPDDVNHVFESLEDKGLVEYAGEDARGMPTWSPTQAGSELAGL